MSDADSNDWIENAAEVAIKSGPAEFATTATHRIGVGVHRNPLYQDGVYGSEEDRIAQALGVAIDMTATGRHLDSLMIMAIAISEYMEIRGGVGACTHRQALQRATFLQAADELVAAYAADQPATAEQAEVKRRGRPRKQKE